MSCAPFIHHCPYCDADGEHERLAEDADAESLAEAREREGDEEDVDWEAFGRWIALEGMDLPDGAYFGMADELEIDP